MRIAATFLTGAALFAGCNTSNSATGRPSSGDTSASLAPVATGAKPAKKSQPYFEMTGADGQTYVFGAVESMLAYQKGQQLPPMTTHQSKGKSVQVETAHAQTLISEYESQHK